MNDAAMVSDRAAPVKSRQLGRRRPKLLSFPAAETLPMAAYKDRVSKDLDRWIAAGLVPEGSREPFFCICSADAFYLKAC